MEHAEILTTPDVSGPEPEPTPPEPTLPDVPLPTVPLPTVPLPTVPPPAVPVPTVPVPDVPLPDAPLPVDAPPEPQPQADEKPPAPVLEVVPTPAPEAVEEVDAALQKRIRAFIALNIPVPLVRKVLDEVQAMKGPIAAAGTKVAWVPAANVHLTLKFLGAIRPEAAEAIAGALRRGLAGRPPFEIELVGMGAFPSLAAPRVLWAGIRQSPMIAALQNDVEAWMVALGFPREERPFHAHLTVGRVTHAGPGGPGGSGGVGVIETQLAPRQTMLFGAARVTEVVLYESRTLAKGAEYRPLARATLGQPQQL